MLHAEKIDSKSEEDYVVLSFADCLQYQSLRPQTDTRVRIFNGF